MICRQACEWAVRYVQFCVPLLSSKKPCFPCFYASCYLSGRTLKTCLLALWVFREWSGMTTIFSLEIHSSAIFFYALPDFHIFWFCYTAPTISVHSAKYAWCLSMAFRCKSVCIIWVFPIVEIFADDRQLYTWDTLILVSLLTVTLWIKIWGMAVLKFDHWCRKVPPFPR